MLKQISSIHVLSGKNELRVSFRNNADTIKFISDNGAVRKVVTNRANATYDIVPGDSYVRVEAISGDESIYLNPVIRYNGKILTFNSGPAVVNMHLTILIRGLVILSSISILLLILALNGKFYLLFQKSDLMRSGKVALR